MLPIVPLILHEMGQYQAAIGAGEEAIDLAKSLGNSLIARVKHNLGLIYYALGQYNQSLLFFDKANEAWQQDQHSKKPFKMN